MQTIEEDVAVELASLGDLETPLEWQLQRTELQFHNRILLGEGGYGCVYCATWLNSTVAVKKVILDPNRPRSECFSVISSTREVSTTAVTATDRKAEVKEALTMFRHEADIWFPLNHPHIVQLFGACDGNGVDQPPIFVCEYATNGPLNKYLREHPDQLLEKLHEVALGVQYLHERDIVHGDLKCNNIVVGSDLKAKVTDFGLSLGSNQVKGEHKPISGAVQWVAPECLADSKVPALDPTIKSDIYSLGMIIIEAMRVVEGVRLNTDEKEFSPYPWGNSVPGAVKYAVKTQRKLPPRPLICSDELWTLITRMCAYEADARIHISTVVHELAILARADNARDNAPGVDPEQLEDPESFFGGYWIRQWGNVLQLTHMDGGNCAISEAGQELEMLFGQIQRSRHPDPRSARRRFYHLIDDFHYAVTNGGFQQFRVFDAMELTSTPPTAHGFYRQIDAYWTDLGLQSEEISMEIQARRSRRAIVQHALIISEETNSWMLLPDLKSEDDRRAFLAYLHSEMKVPDYTPEQLFLMRQACDAIAKAPTLSKLTSKPKWFISWLEIEIEPSHSLIGKGNFGKVSIAKWLGSTVAVKELYVPYRESSPSWISSSGDDLDEPDSPQNDREEILKRFTREVEIWFSLSHPHVIRLYGACHIGTPFFVCEYGSNGSLNQYLRRHPDQVWQKLHEAALGIEYLHERGVIHGSLKCHDIVVTSDGKAKVTDFGMGNRASEADDERGTDQDAYRWKAPECLDGAAPTMEADIYSLGMCVVEALRFAGGEKSPFPWSDVDDPAIKYIVSSNRRLPSRPEMCTDQQWALVTSMCKLNPQDRISSSAVVEKLARIAAAASAIHP
jgi:serine/threonine protein kinase